MMSWNLNLQGVAQDQITSVLLFVNCLHAMATPTAMLCATSSLPIAVRVSWIHMARFQVNHTQFSRSLENWTRFPRISLSWVHVYKHEKIRTLSALCLLLCVSSTLKSIACWHLQYVSCLHCECSPSYHLHKKDPVCSHIIISLNLCYIWMLDVTQPIPKPPWSKLTLPQPPGRKKHFPQTTHGFSCF